MRILVTGGECAIARMVIAALQPEHELRVVGKPGSKPADPAVYHAGDIRDAAFAASIVSDVDAIVHLAPLVAHDDANEWLDVATRGTYALLNEALEAGVRRVVVGSTLDLFERVEPAWQVLPRWRPRPRAEPAQLAAWLAELSARELGRFPQAAVACVRFGEAKRAAIAATLAAALQAPPGFTAFHVGARPYRGLLVPAPPAARPVRTIAIFGAGGPLGAVLAQELAPHYRLRVSDVLPLAELAHRPRPDQHPDAPRPAPLMAPHGEIVADVTDPAQVLAVCEGADAIVNCSVVRHHPVEAFRVNTLGTYNIMRAAVAHGIRRVVQTGPQQHTVSGESDYSADYDIVDDAPPRPGRNLYFHSKYLGQEICRVYATQYGLDVPVLLFSDFVQPGNLRRNLYYFSISWRDAAQAIRAALDAQLPTPYEVFNISADLPHGVISNQKAKYVLNWAPEDDLSPGWLHKDDTP